MSYDRVLPKPAALYYDPARNNLPRRPTSNLLEHKIMNDHFSKVTVADRADSASAGPSTSKYGTDPATSSAALSHLSSAANREKVALNEISSSASLTRKRVAPLLMEDVALHCRFSSSSPSRLIPSKDSVVQFCLCQPDPKIPRPRNAFILYRQHYQAAVVAQNPGLANPEISKIIGEQWRALPNETKSEWKALAEEEKARHQQQYPDYRYQPRRYGRDGGSRSATSSGISHNPTGATVCNRCGGRIMNPPSTPDTPFPTSAQPTSSTRSPNSSSVPARTLPSRGTKDAVRSPSPVKLYTGIDHRASRHRNWEENGSRSPEPKRRRFNANGIYNGSYRDRSPDTPYPASPQRTYGLRGESTQSRGPFPMLPPPRQYRSHDPSLTLPPLQTALSSQPDRQDVEAMVMTIPFLNKIKVLAKISPPFVSSPRSAESQHKGTVIAVDGQDSAAVKVMVKYLGSLLTKEGKYSVRVFEGPKIPPRQKNGEMRDATIDYINTISAWHRVSEEIIHFIRSPSESFPGEASSAAEEPSSGISPKSSVPKTTKLHTGSPLLNLQKQPNGGAAAGPISASPSLIPIALVPQYQLTTADAFACAVPIDDSYAPLDHWQWMASLWRACIGPDITVYIRECEREELERYGSGNPVEVRLNDARTLVVRRAAGSSADLEEKALRRVSFEVEDFLTR
ncbi:hypothetical protein VTN00DRAFT_10219 [Thermoascus crustaceus]|uniref:uncharacterized protein n=1 Tax=Thermoascus crustaceus TaxID=5088 RepID=UPI003743B443